ncbi:MAG: helix-turn-helix transcriptional regulator [Candidatus Merdivicinus sp.]
MNEISISYTTYPVSPFPTAFHPTYHSHSHDEMLIVLSGDIIAMAANTYLTHKGPCVLFYKKQCPHAQINGEGVPYERYCIGFDRNTIAEFFPDLSLFASFRREDAFLLPLDSGEAERLAAAAKLLYQCPRTEEPNIRQRLLLCYIFAEVTEIGRQRSSSPPVHFYLTAVTQHIAAHIQEKLTIDGIAAEFHIGRTKLIRDFREFFSMSVSQYITMERLVRARMLLQRGEAVAVAAEECGFTDSAYFIRVFRKYYGITPAKYRRQCAEVPVYPFGLD